MLFLYVGWFLCMCCRIKETYAFFWLELKIFKFWKFCFEHVVLFSPISYCCSHFCVFPDILRHWNCINKGSVERYTNALQWRIKSFLSLRSHSVYRMNVFKNVLIISNLFESNWTPKTKRKKFKGMEKWRSFAKISFMIFDRLFWVVEHLLIENKWRDICGFQIKL